MEVSTNAAKCYMEQNARNSETLYESMYYFDNKV